MKDFSKEKIYGIIGTAVFHILVLLLLYLLVMEQIPPQPEKSNIEMQGAVEDVAGEEVFEAKVVPDERPQEVPSAQNTPSKAVEEPLIAQRDEQSIPVDTVKSVNKDKKPVQSEADKRRAEEERRKAAEEAERRAKEEAERKAKEKIAKSVAGGKNDGVGNSGTAEGGTDRGVETGTGNGHGIEASVGNRKVVGELNRKIPVQEEGTVVVHVTVNPMGQVVSANARTTSVTLKRVAEKEAMKIRFNKVSELTENENGTITFRFKMNY